MTRSPAVIKAVTERARTFLRPYLLVLVACAVLTATACSGEPEPPPRALLQILTGSAEVLSGPGADFTVVTSEAEINKGARIRVPQTSQALVIFFEGSVVFVDGGSDITIEELSGSRQTGASNVALFQAVGRTVHRVSKIVDAESSYSVRTSSAIGGVRGTGFILEVDAVAGAKWKSFEGRVGVAGVLGIEVQVEAGKSAQVPPGADPSPPVDNPLTPEEQVLVDTIDAVIEQRGVSPPSLKDPEQSTPAAGPTPPLPTIASSAAAAAVPTDTPTLLPTPSSMPTATSAPSPTSTPTAPAPSPEPTSSPTATPTSVATPTPSPTASATPSPTPIPPTLIPTPTGAPTRTPTPAAVSTPPATFTPTPRPTPTPTPPAEPVLTLSVGPSPDACSVVVSAGTDARDSPPQMIVRFLVEIDGNPVFDTGSTVEDHVIGTVTARFEVGGFHTVRISSWDDGLHETEPLTRSLDFNVDCDEQAETPVPAPPTETPTHVPTEVQLDTPAAATTPTSSPTAVPTLMPTETPTPTPTESEEPPSTVIHIGGISTSFEHFDGNSDAIYFVTILDQNGAAVPGVSVGGEVSGPLGTFPISGLTGANGIAELRHNTTSFGTYNLTVTSVAGAGMTYDSSATVTISAGVTLK